MSDFKIEFAWSPWLLLLIIPALAYILFVYFRVEKKFRRIGKRRASLVLHIIISILCIVALSGIHFSWATDEFENELVILVDCSYSEQSSRARADGFVHDIIEANNGKCNFAVVKFGFDQVLAVKMGSHRVESSFEDYLEADEPDTTATDIRSALTYIWDPVTKKSGGDTNEPIISDPKTARVLLISDGLQTDRDAMSVAKLMALDGIRLDTSFFPANYPQDAWIVDATYPDKTFDVGEQFEIDVTVHSSYNGTYSLNFSDNGEVKFRREEMALKAGVQKVKIFHSFEKSGHHELKFGMTSSGDTTLENNVYYTTYDLEEYNSILIVERYEGESQQIVDILKSRPDAQYLTIKVVGLNAVPTTIDALSEFDEVILVNVAHRDMPANFEDLLYEYVYNRGGGLFTVGGFEKNSEGKIIMKKNKEGEDVPIAHSYDAADMQGTKLQDMLPVKIEEYSPPTALAIIIDRSASMEQHEEAPFEVALDGALAAVDAMSPKDFVGVMTMNNSYHVELDLTPMTQKSKIVDAIYRVADEVGGSNSETAAIEHACRALAAMRSVEKKHVLLITDGRPGDPARDYQAVMQKYYDEFGISITIISVLDPIINDLKQLAEIGHGGAYQIPYNIKKELPFRLRRDLGLSEEFMGAVAMEYNPTLNTHTPIVNKITQSQLDEIDMKGFFVSRVKNQSVQVSLMAKFVPLYAQWNFGAGKVGSFMSDLFGVFSGPFAQHEEAGIPIVNNIISSLMPVMDIQEHSLNVEFILDNYRTQASIDGYNFDSENDKKLIAFVEAPNGTVSKFDLSELSIGGNRFTFENFEPGIHVVTVIKVPKSFDVFSGSIQNVSDVPSRYVMAMIRTYRPFSYSEEFDSSRDSFEEGRALLINISSRTDAEGEDKLVDSAETFAFSIVSLRKSFDPRYLLIGIALALFLIEIAVRKFRFSSFTKFLERLGLKKKKDSV